ncbi:hypothetical protein TEA_028094 [Camellia sinensis var. sinensis]|uniref:Uncharacterized protein n=1 Tax=Camellia sinensis var. sinensis TaxID=542762 RepID=A0A4S4EWC7_CAMSN|nr:hypothetical protein TEA_028094 [Camellia sinensis var. sinensis]
MAGLSINENASMTQQKGTSPGSLSENMFFESAVNPNHQASNNVLNGILGSQATGVNANSMFPLGPMAYNIPSGLMFSPAFPSQPVNYGAMGNFLTQQQFLSTISNFQQVGNLQSQNTGVSHAAGTKGVYSSPLPDIFNPNIPTRTPSSVMNSSKKEDTKAFDFISKTAYSLSGAGDALRINGPEYATQCPICPGNSYTYRFNIIGHEETLWWHAHSQWLQATVYGALIICPKVGHSYPFLKPYREFPIPLGTYKVNVARGKTYLLRIINAAMNNQFFFKIADQKMTVVAVDATYITPMVIDVIVIAPGQTIDALLTADQLAASYYMAVHTYISSEGVPDATASTTGIIVYENAMSSTPRMPVLPAFNDTPTAYKSYTNLTALVNAPHWVPVPLNTDEHMFVTVSLGLVPCEAGSTCAGPLQQRLAASLNNASFEFNTKLSMMEAFFNNVDGIYTTDFLD